jgi:hypothetical protein
MKTEQELHIHLTQSNLRKLLWFLVGLDIILALIYLLVFVIAPNFSWGPIDRWFDLDDDMSIPSWFASLQYLFIGIPTLISAMQSSGKNLVSKKFLYFMGAISIFLALDEAVGVHEQISVVTTKLDLSWLKILAFKGSHGVWISIYALLGIILLALIYRDLLTIWFSFRKEALYILIGGVMLVLGEAGLEVISYLFLRTAASGLLYNLEVAGEEFFALVGVSIIFYGVLTLLAKVQPAAQIEK